MHFTLQKTMASLKLCQMTTGYGFITTSIIPLTTKLDRMTEKRAMILLCRHDGAITTKTSFLPSTNPTTNKSYMKGDQHAVILPCSC